MRSPGSLRQGES